jgi:hypothetical protein
MVPVLSGIVLGNFVPGVASENPMISLGLSFYDVSHKKLPVLLGLFCSSMNKRLRPAILFVH